MKLQPSLCKLTTGGLVKAETGVPNACVQTPSPVAPRRIPARSDIAGAFMADPEPGWRRDIGEPNRLHEVPTILAAMAKTAAIQPEVGPVDHQKSLRPN